MEFTCAAFSQTAPFSTALDSHCHKHWGFDAQLSGNERRLAAGLRDGDGSAALFRVDAERAVPILIIPLTGARRLLFCGDNLVVGVATYVEVKEAVLYSTTGDRLQRDRQLIARDERLDFWRWCFVDGTIFA